MQLDFFIKQPTFLSTMQAKLIRSTLFARINLYEVDFVTCNSTLMIISIINTRVRILKTKEKATVS